MMLHEIKSKADYISDLAFGIMNGAKRAEIPQTLIDDICRQLSNIADTLDEYHDYGEDE